MGKKNRYDYACKCYKDYVILLLIKNCALIVSVGVFLFVNDHEYF